MKIRLRWILTAPSVLLLVSAAGAVFASPVGVPQQMMPNYVPASPSQGVASFRPHFRAQPLRPAARFAPPGRVPPAHAPVRRAGNWPLPVSYRPMLPPAPRYAPPYGYRGPAPRWAGYRPPMRNYAVPAAPRMVYGYPARPPVGVQGYPQVRQYRPRLPYPPMVPVRYRQPNWTVPGRASMPRAYHGYPQRQAYPAGPIPGPRALPRRFAGRYQPYSRVPTGRSNYQFRPMPRPAAYRGYPMPQRYGAAPFAAPNYRSRPDPRQAGQVRRPMGSYQAQQMRDRPMSRGELLAWRNTAQRFPGSVY